MLFPSSAPVSAGAYNRTIADLYFTRRRPLEPGQHIEHCGLAAAARPEQAKELAGLYLQIEIADGNVIAALHGTENLIDARESNQRQGDAPKAQ